MPRDANAPELRDPIADLVTEFNRRYFVVNEAGKTVVYEPVFNPMLKRNGFVRFQFADFRKLYMNRQICVGVDEKKRPVLKPVADVWLTHPDRRQYLGGIIFDPSGKHTRDDTLNLWQGFAVDPKPGKWDLMKAHILKIICAGNQGHYDYLFGWMARMVQYPAEQGEVAVVMQSAEGAGKGTLANVLLRILGQHGLTISNAKHLTGNFNAHLRDCVFLFGDEVFFAGDKSHIGALKALITEPFLTIEGKNQNVVQVPNYLHVMLASNEKWVVPASTDARRWFVLQASDARANDDAYFAAIWGEMANGGYEGMLHELLNHDLTFFNVRRPPATDGLLKQKKLSLGTSEGWWLDILHRGYVYRSKLGLEEYFSEWHAEVSTEVLFASYEVYATARHERHPMTRETIGSFMRDTAGAKPKRLSKTVVGEHMTTVEETSFGGTRTARLPALIHHPRPPGYRLGTLQASRSGFARNTSITGDWQDETC